MDSNSRTFYLGRYNCIEQLGSGPLGETFRAKIYGVAGFEKQFAVKRLHLELSSDENFVTRFVQAASAFAALDHQRITRVHEVNAQDAHYYIVLDLVRGLDLRRLLDLLQMRGEALSADVAATIAVDVAEALEYAHANTTVQPGGVLHLGLTAQSVMVTYEGGLKLIDVGLLAGLIRPGWSDDDALTPTLAYVAPEVWRGDEMDAGADIFSLGVLLHELTGGRRVFFSDRAAELRQAIESGPPPPPPAEPRLQKIITRALQPNRAARFATMREMRVALQEVVRGRSERAHADLSALVRRLALPRERRTGAFSAISMSMANGDLLTPLASPNPPSPPHERAPAATDATVTTGARPWAPPASSRTTGTMMAIPRQNTLAGIGPSEITLGPEDMIELTGATTEKTAPPMHVEDAETHRIPRIGNDVGSGVTLSTTTLGERPDSVGGGSNGAVDATIASATADAFADVAATTDALGSHGFASGIDPVEQGASARAAADWSATELEGQAGVGVRPSADARDFGSFAPAARADDSFAPADRAADSFAPAGRAADSFAPADRADDSFAPANRAAESFALPSRANESFTSATRAAESFMPSSRADESFVPTGRADDSFAPSSRANESFASAARANESFAPAAHDGGSLPRAEPALPATAGIDDATGGASTDAAGGLSNTTDTLAKTAGGLSNTTGTPTSTHADGAGDAANIGSSTARRAAAAGAAGGFAGAADRGFGSAVATEDIGARTAGDAAIAQRPNDDGFAGREHADALGLHSGIASVESRSTAESAAPRVAAVANAVPAGDVPTASRAPVDAQPASAKGRDVSDEQRAIDDWGDVVVDDDDEPRATPAADVGRNAATPAANGATRVARIALASLLEGPGARAADAPAEDATTTRFVKDSQPAGEFPARAAIDSLPSASGRPAPTDPVGGGDQTARAAGTSDIAAAKRTSGAIDDDATKPVEDAAARRRTISPASGTDRWSVSGESELRAAAKEPKAEPTTSGVAVHFDVSDNGVHGDARGDSEPRAGAPLELVSANRQAVENRDSRGMQASGGATGERAVGAPSLSLVPGGSGDGASEPSWTPPPTSPPSLPSPEPVFAQPSLGRRETVEPIRSSVPGTKLPPRNAANWIAMAAIAGLALAGGTAVFLGLRGDRPPTIVLPPGATTSAPQGTSPPQLPQPNGATTGGAVNNSPAQTHGAAPANAAAANQAAPANTAAANQAAPANTAAANQAAPANTAAANQAAPANTAAANQAAPANTAAANQAAPANTAAANQAALANGSGANAAVTKTAAATGNATTPTATGANGARGATGGAADTVGVAAPGSSQAAARPANGTANHAIVNLAALARGQAGDAKKPAAESANATAAIAPMTTPAPNAPNAPAGVSFGVTSVPAGAAVFVDGEARGTTPAQLMLTPGAHKLVVAAEHHRLLTRDITANAGAALSLTLEPTKLPSTIAGPAGLKVRCHSHGELRILVDGADSGLSCPNDERISVTAGMHKIGLHSVRTGQTHELEREIVDGDYSTRVYVKF